MQNSDPDAAAYDAWADYYDLGEGDRAPYIDFYGGLLGNGARSILELGCGTGVIVSALAQRLLHEVDNSDGRSVRAVGIDASDGMLKIARARDASVQWILGDIRSPPVEGKFDLVFCCFNTLQFLHLDQDLVQAFDAARELIGGNGVFAFDIYQPNLAYLENSQSDKLARSLIDRDGRALEIREDSSYDPRTQVLSLNWRLQEKGSPDRQPLARTSFHLRQFFARDLGRLLRDAGLVVHERYGDFGNQPFNAGSRKQILICGSD